jgi:ABC-2 type transport system permease protein
MRIIAVMVRILLQLKHDKRTIGLMLLAPIFVLTLMAFVFNGSDYHPKIGVVNAPISFINKLEDKDAVIKRLTEESAIDAISSNRVDAVINFVSGVPKIKLEGSEPSKTKAVLMLVQNAMQKPITSNTNDITYVYGYEDMTSFDNFGPILIGFFVFFFVFLIAGVSFLGERTSGTLERLLATPLKRWEIVVGYVLGFGSFTILQSALIAWYCIDVLNIMMVGSFFLVILITILSAMVALTIGTFISAFANNELQMIQFIPIIVVPQIFFSGLFDISTMASWLQAIGRIMPLWYIADALKSIMIKGKGWNDIAINVYILLGFCLFFMFANILALKKYRKI